MHRCLKFLLASGMISSLATHKTNMSIEIQPTQVGQLYYEIHQNGEPLDTDIGFEIYDANNQLIQTSTTENAILHIQNLPFGTYKIVLGADEFNVTIDSDYLLTQHMLKIFQLSSISTKTGDKNAIVDYLCLMGVSLLILGYASKKRR